MKKDPLIFIEHILENISDIENFSRGINKEVFEKNLMRQKAIIRSIEIIGEAVANLPKSFREKHPQVSWKEIVGTRDKMIHHYFGVNTDIVWDIIKKNLPTLKQKIQKIKKQLTDDKNIT